jgi:hypothetical protein
VLKRAKSRSSHHRNPSCTNVAIDVMNSTTGSEALDKRSRD